MTKLKKAKEHSTSIKMKIFLWDTHSVPSRNKIETTKETSCEAVIIKELIKNRTKPDMVMSLLLLGKKTFIKNKPEPAMCK